MYPQLRDKIEDYVVEYGLSDLETIEIGSYDYCGGVKDFFHHYIGIDRQAGPGVDIVMDAHDLAKAFQPLSIDVVVWLESIEHDEAFWITRDEIRKVLKPGGYLVLSAPEYLFPAHCCPADYYRFSIEAIRLLLHPWTSLIDMSTIRGPGNPANMGTITALAQKVHI
jgi:hypothetical protein